MTDCMTWLDSYRQSPERLVVGLMSGTSADGVDAVLCRISDPASAKDRAASSGAPSRSDVTGSCEAICTDRQPGFNETPRPSAADTESCLPVAGNGFRAEVLHITMVPYPPAVRELLLGDLRRLNAEEVCRLNVLVADVFSEAALRCVAEAGLSPSNIMAVASHGQTIVHFPRPDHPVLPVRATLQVGDISHIAQKTGILTVGDFRPADMAQGGQGAPLVPYADYTLLAHPTLGRIVQNIGGIANCTYLPPSCGPEDVIAFDTGPGNMVVDALMSLLTGGKQGMDTDGRMALSGTPDDPMLDALLSHPFFRTPPPKSTGREEFGVQYAEEILKRMHAKDADNAGMSRLDMASVRTASPDMRSVKVSGSGMTNVDVPGANICCANTPNLAISTDVADIIATASELTVRSIVDAYRSFIFPKGRVDQVIVGGGGAKNPYFMGRLREELAPAVVLTHEDVGIPSQAKEALAFAILGDALLMGRPNNIPSATGARKPVAMGKIALPWR